MKKLTNVFIVLFLIVGVGLGAQTTPSVTAAAGSTLTAGIILYADGVDFSIYRSSVLRTYEASAGSTIGMGIEVGDLVQTGPGTVLEIQLIPGQSVVKIAENTSFRVVAGSGNNPSELEVLYGRLRARIDSVMGAQGFSVRGKTATAGVRGTDFGYEVVAVPGFGQDPSSRIYTYDGLVVVRPISRGQTEPDEDAEEFELAPGSMITVFDTPDEAMQDNVKTEAGETILSKGKRTVLHSPSIPEPIKEYWKHNEFKSEELPSEQISEIVQSIQTPKAGNASTMNVGTSQIIGQETQTSRTRTTAADLVAPLSPVDALGSIKQPQYVLADDGQKIVGIILSSVGLAGSLTGLTVYTYGTDLFSASENDSRTIGLVTFSGSAALSIGGLILYIIGAVQ